MNWLKRQIPLQITYGALLAIIVLATVANAIVNAIWPHHPSWVSYAGGFAIGGGVVLVERITGWSHSRSRKPARSSTPQ